MCRPLRVAWTNKLLFKRMLAEPDKPAVAKAFTGVDVIRQVFEDRKAAEVGELGSHGEAGRYFVSFLDNHDQQQRIQHPSTPVEQVTLALLFSLQGIPCVYYVRNKDSLEPWTEMGTRF
jgi:hypothetical protein